MPSVCPRPCRHPGCPGLVRERGRVYCPDHAALEAQVQADRYRRHDRLRGTAASRGYDHRWQAARARWLAAHPMCCDPDHLHPRESRAATVVDHIVPHRGDRRLFWDRANWQSLCTECHNRKTSKGL